ncbi:MAG: AAA family ATPase [Candidatus Heimdallarchaeota archaeon]|nr:AAA family ATPase [Candidatus Heimdallarchaeota archaeon]
MMGYFLVHTVDLPNQMIKVIDRESNILSLEIQAPWIDFLPYLRNLLELYLEIEDGKVGENNLFVIEPSYLIPVTTITDAMSCLRKIYINTLGARDTPEKKQLLRMMEGNALHDVFSLKITNDTIEIDEMIELVVNNTKSDLVTLAVDEDRITNYLKANAGVFNRFQKLNGLTEIDNQNWKLGVHGKFDGLVRKNILELKTSKIPDSIPWENHNSQINIYKHMMADRGNFNGMIYYVRDNKMVNKKPYEIPQHQWLLARNWSLLVLKGEFTPQVLRENYAKACRYCFVKNGCMNLCAGLITQRDCERCTQSVLCDKKSWPKEATDYYTHFVTALNAEEQEEIKAQKWLSRVGLKDSRQRDVLINRGYAIQTTNKIDEVFKRGKYEIVYSHKSIMNRFRRGDFIKIYNLEDTHDISTMYFSAVITDINADQIYLESTNKLPHKVVIVSSDSSASYRGSKRALHFTILSNSRLLDIIKGKTNLKNFQVVDKVVELINPLMKYNPLQQSAIENSLQSPDIFLIQGPAGTGKTSLIVEIVNQLFFSGKRILVSAFTNMAIDNIGLSLKKYNIPFVRLGRPHSINKELHEYSIETRQEEYITAIENDLPLVILSTTSSIAKDLYVDLMMDYVILDEAAQMTEPENLKALLHGERAILVGDHQQLQPIVQSQKAKQLRLQHSLFERLVDQIPNRHVLLTHQYRMNSEILSFPNGTFYDGKLQPANEEIAFQQISTFRTKLTSSDPYQVISLQDNKIVQGLQVNRAEVVVIIALICDLIENVPDLSLNDIGIITPFRAQVAELRRFLPFIQIDTIDRFQGSENEIIIFSSITTANVPILSDPRRINVALTRAKKKLIVLVTNPHVQGQTLMNRLYVDAQNRDLVTDLHSSDIQDYSSDKIFNSNLETISSHSKIKTISVDTYNPFIDLKDLIGKSAGIFFNTILMMETDIDGVEFCPICRLVLDFGVQCLGCSYWYHKDHLVEWVKDSSNCPVCKHSLIIVSY